ncbi:MAG: HEAT repeat domain-containing protein [Planctomycetes bacterium]|nr:HEAT repeat domain-containing protein [Planctomycetota bacterium]
MKHLRLFAFHLLCLMVIFSFLANIARAQDKLKPTKAQTQPSESARFIQFVNDLLTVKVKYMSLHELLQVVGHQSDLTIVWYGSIAYRITIEFHNLPLDEGMRLILHNHSFALAYAQQTAGERHSTVPEMVWIFSKGGKGYPTKSTVLDGHGRRTSLKHVPTDIPRLQAAMTSEDPRKREEAVDALGESLHPEAVPLLRLALEDADEDVREAAVDALEEIGGDEAAQALAIALGDQDSSVREEAVEALGEIGGETAIGLLEQALADEDESIRETAAEMNREKVE